MAIAQRGTPTSAMSTTLPITGLTLPSGIADNDGLLLVAGVGDVADVVSTPAGWSLADHSIKGSGAGLGAYVFRKVGVSADGGASMSLGTSDAVKGTAVSLAYSGTDHSNNIHKINVAIESTSQTMHTSPTVTTDVDGCWIFLVCVHKDSSSTTVGTLPSGYTLVKAAVRTALTGVTSISVYAKGPVNAGTYGGESVGFDAASASAITYTIALAPVPTTQTLRPTSDITKTNVAGVSDNSTLYTNVDESSLNTADYVEFIQTGVYETKLSTGSSPGGTAGWQAAYVLGLGDGATTSTWDVYLMEGATQRAHWTDTVTSDNTAVTHTLTSGQAAAITGFTDLRLRFVLTAVS